MRILLVTLLITLSTFAHDGGHGPALRDESFYGGKVAAIINANEIKKGPHAEMLYKAELVYESRKPEVKLYFYDKKMKPLNLKEFGKSVNAVIAERGSEKKFTLTLDKSGTFYTGERPMNKRVPFNIDVNVKKGDEGLFGAFDGLD